MMMNVYEVISTVGEGAHGIVLKARDTEDGKIVALKKISPKKVLSEGIPLQVVREIKSLQCLHHPHVVHLFGVFPQSLSFVLVFEFMPTNLMEVLDRYRLDGSQIKCYMLMLLKAVAFLHDKHILHRDLKPANLLIGETGVLKIGDFGLCRLYFKGENRAYSHQVATRWYRSPELLYGARYYDVGVDLWATGVICAEMLKGEPLFPGENDIDQLYRVISSLGTPTDASWPGREELPDYNKISFRSMEPVSLSKLVVSNVPGYQDFLGRFLIYDPQRRISAHEALEHKFFKLPPLACDLNGLPPLPPPKATVTSTVLQGVKRLTFSSSSDEDDDSGSGSSSSTLKN